MNRIVCQRAEKLEIGPAHLCSKQGVRTVGRVFPLCWEDGSMGESICCASMKI